MPAVERHFALLSSRKNKDRRDRGSRNLPERSLVHSYPEGVLIRLRRVAYSRIGAFEQSINDEHCSSPVFLRSHLDLASHRSQPGAVTR